MSEISPADQTPRIHAEYLTHYVSRRVRVVGKIVDVQGNTAQMNARGNVRLLLNQGANLIPGNYFEVIAEVQPDLSLRLLASTNFGTEIDEELVTAAVENWQKHHKLFMK